MQCFTCNQYYDTKVRVPLIDHQGTTMCEPCYLQSSQSGLKKCTINKQLIKLLGKCPNHMETDLSLFDIKSKKRMCPKCVIFCKEKKKYEDCVFIQIDSEANKIDIVLANNIEQIKDKISSIEDNIVEKIKIQIERTKTSVLSTLQQEYKRYLSSLNEAYQKEQRKVLQKIISIENEFYSESIASVKRLNQLKSSVGQFNFKAMAVQLKYEAVADFLSTIHALDQVQANLYAQSILTNNNLKGFSNEYQCGFSILIEKKQRGLKLLNLEEQLLLSKSNSRKVQQEQVTYMDFSLDLTKSSYNLSSLTSTERTVTETSSTSEFIAQVKPKGKSCLTIGNIGELNKIQTNIKEVVVKNLEISNTEGKKVLNLISKSFVKNLDLSGNKLSNNFLKEINKANVGKYLKTINLQRNQIDGKDGGVQKKIQLLKSQGVAILI